MESKSFQITLDRIVQFSFHFAVKRHQGMCQRIYCGKEGAKAQVCSELSH